MVDGYYSVMLKTPMGVKNGELTLKVEDELLYGKMSILGNDNPIAQGTAKENEFRFQGEIKTAVGELAYECIGNVDGNILNGIVKTNKGNFILNGNRK